MTRLYATFVNKKERDAMHAFLLEQDLSLLDHSETGGFVLRKGEDMGFPARVGGTILGFDEIDLSQKIWALVAWMSVCSSLRKDGWSFLMMDDEEIPVAITTRPHEEGVLCVNEAGILNSWIERELPIGPNPHIQKQAMLVLAKRYQEKTKRIKKVIVDKGTFKPDMEWDEEPLPSDQDA